MTRHLLRLVFAAVIGACVAWPVAAQESLAARAQALRATLGPPSDSLTEDRGNFLRRQLLSSLERRQDLERLRSEIARVAGQVATAPTPDSLLALDDLRRELQQLDATLAGGERRRAILVQERSAVAAQLVERVASQRALADAGVAGEKLEIAKLETELIESAIAEIDVMLRLIDAQQEAWVLQRGALARRAAAATQRGSIKVTARDAAAIDQRLSARARDLRRRLAAAAAAGERIRTELRQARAPQSPARGELLTQQLANADLDIELAREALANVATEQMAWQVTLRYYRDGDPAAVVEAREQTPALLERLQRRREFLAALSEQTRTQLGQLAADPTAPPASAEAAERRALRAVYEQRLGLVEAAMFDESQLAHLIERMRAGFEERIGMSTWGDRARLAAATLRAWAGRGWNLELFTVNQTIDVDGRKTTVPRGVTIGKLVKAPLLLVLTLWLAWRLTRWGERWLVVRRNVDEGSARLLRRWVLALLIAACVLVSLALAGIPLAAFAFIGGAVAIGIGFGMQNLFKNLISGALVLMERPFRLGDVIEVDGLRGTVVDIDLRTSVIRDRDGAETLIPNSALMEHNVKNVTFRSRLSRQALVVVVDGASDPRTVADVMCAAAARHGQLAESQEPSVLLDEFADNGLRFVLHYWIELRPGIDPRRVASDLRLMVLGAFEEAGIRLAPPPVR
jgi:potassium efflux system protein